MEIQLSAVVVTYNEARFLPECLRRLAFCDDLVVIDLGSRDELVEIARRFGARVFLHERVLIGEKVRKFALQQVKNDWVLFSDPDLYYPEGIGSRLISLIAGTAPEGEPPVQLGCIYLPIQTCFGGKPLVYGQKGEVKSFMAVINRCQVELMDLLHHRGVALKPGAVGLGLRRVEGEAIQHYWIDTIQDAVVKGQRYLQLEGESRHALGMAFSWGGVAAELWRSLKVDLRRSAFRDWRAIQVMLFQLWYIWNANLAWRRYEHGMRAKRLENRE